MHKFLVKRIMAFTLSICMIAGMIDLSGFTVHAAVTLSGGTITLASTSEVFTGSEIKPAVTSVTDLAGNTVSDSEYEVSYQNNTNVGRASVTVTNKQDPTDTNTNYFQITPRSIKQCTIGNIDEQFLSPGGRPVTPQITVTDPGRADLTLTSDDYTFAFTDNDKGGTATVTVSGKGNYNDSTTKTFTVTELVSEKLTFTLPDGNIYGYVAGAGVEPDVSDVKYDGKALNDDQYAVRYEGNRVAADNTAKVIVEGRGRYTGLKSEQTFSIRKVLDKNYGASTITVGTIAPQSFKGEGQPVTLTESQIPVNDPDLGPLTGGTDFVILADTYQNHTHESSGNVLASVMIEGKGKYTGKKEVFYKIEAATLEAEMVAIDDSMCKYDGTTNWYEKLKVTVSSGTIEYVKGTDYDITPVDNGVLAGMHYITITPKGKLKGNAVRKFYTVKQRELSEADISFTSGTPDYTYDNTAKKPAIQIIYTQGDGTDYTLRAGIDYESQLNYGNNINASTDSSRAEVWAIGKGNFTGESNHLPFDIKPVEMTSSNTQITGIPTSPVTYTGSEITFNNLNVRVNGRALTPNTDYTVSYENNVEVGSNAVITIEGKGNYQGIFREGFTITECSLKDTRVITVDAIPAQQYEGADRQITPEVTVKHSGRVLVKDTDYTVEYGENIKVGSGSVTIIGINNYKDSITKNFSIVQRNIGTGELLVNDDAASYDYNTMAPEDIYYEYDGEAQTPELRVTYNNMEANISNTLVKGTDYDITFSRNKEIGTAQFVIQAKGNYTGTKTFNFTIKGNLADYGTGENAYTQITIPDQIYTSNPVVPANAEVKFNGKLLTSDDYMIECSNNTDAGTGTALADITGTGLYFGKAQGVPFNILPLDLSNDSLEENGYVISGVDTNYTYSGFPINPVPSISHNGNLLEEGTAYRVEYNEEGVDNVNASKEGSKGKLVIYGIPDNYTGSHDVEFTIDPYDIGKGESGEYNNGSSIEVEGLVEDVILDRIKDTAGVAMGDYNPDAVVQTDLQVYYTGAGLDGTTAARRPLTPDTEYTVEYENNETIGTAVIIIKGKGNFAGEIRKEFKIRGDLSADTTTLEVKDCVYSPAGEEGNIPEHKVIYTITRASGAEIPIELVEGVDYVAQYDNNKNATVGEDAHATMTILPVKAEDGTEIGNYTGEKSADFQIEQRDISAAIESEGNPKDPDLDVSGLAEEGYEYTGEQIVPQLQVSCKGTDLTWIFEGNTDQTEYDYVISAVNNTDVYEYGEGPHGEKERLYPTVTVTARKDENGDFTGNYKGSFQMRFQINPRVISAETVDTIEPVSGMENEMDYTGEEVRFPLKSEDPADAGKNALRVTWSKEGTEGTIRTPLVEGKDYQISYKDNIKIGEAKVVISAVNESNYTGEYEKPFKIMASIEVVDQENPPLKYMTLEYDENVPFGIVNVYPEMIFEDYSGVLCGESNEPKILTEGEDFEIVTEENQGDAADVSRNNRNVASKDDEDETKRPLVVIRGKGCYRGVIKRYYNIIPKDLAADQGDITAEFIGSTSTEEYENAYIYTGEEIKPEIRVYNHGELMVPNVDYVVEGYVNNTEISTEENQAGVIIKAVDGGNYLNQKTMYFNIIRRPISGMEVTITGGPQIFNRQEKQPEVEVSYMDGTNKIVLTKEDYDLSYENNIIAATEFSGDDAPVIIITGKGAYGGEIRKKFTILPESFEIAEGQEDDFEIKAENAIYTGKPVTTTIEVKAKDGTLLVEGEDYELGAYTDNTNIGTGMIAITGKGNYTGTRQVPFRIVPAEGRIRVEEIPDQTYNGSEIAPKPQVFFKVENVEGIEDMEFPLTEGEDYELSYANNINVGTASVTVTGTGNFPGRETADFNIVPKSICRDVSGDDGLASDMVLGDIEDQLYTGRGVTPNVELTYRRNQSNDEEADQKLILNRDYTLSYAKNVAVGMAEVSITGIGNFTGTVQSSFRILGTMNLANIEDIPVQQYTGAPVTPKPQITFAGTELIENTDYILEYDNNIERGTATIKITGMGWYTGTRTVNFDIAREFSEETMVRGIAAAYTYTGEAIVPVVRVEDNGSVLTNGTDYQVSYGENTNVGTGTITITGINRYRGTRNVTFKIVPQNISRASVTNIGVQTYTGKDITPAVQVTNGGKALNNGKDYQISYVDNKYPGTGRVIVRGDGNYTGTQTINFNIIVPGVTGVKASKYTASSITFSWTKNNVVSGYEIYNSKNKLQVRIKKNSTTKSTVKNLKAGTVSTYKVRAFVIKGGKYHYSDFVSLKTGTAPKATSITGLNSSKSKRVVIKWKKIKGATTYQVYRSTSKKGKYTKIASTSKNVYTDKKAKGGKKYYYKIRVGKKNGNKTYYSSYSKVKSVKAKK